MLFIHMVNHRNCRISNRSEIIINLFYYLYYVNNLSHFNTSDSTSKNKSLYIGMLSVFAALIQFNGYGSGFLINFIEIYI